MARKPSVRFYASRGGFFATINGTLHRLATCTVDDSPHGRHFLEACHRFGQLIASPQTPHQHHQHHQEPTLGAICQKYRDWQGEHGKNTIKFDDLITKLLTTLGDTPVNELKPWMIEDALRKRSRWTTSKGIAYRELISIVRWAKIKQYIAVNPLADLKLGREYRIVLRGHDFAMPDCLVEKILATVKGRFRDYIFALSETGARPKELALARSYNYDAKRQEIVFSGQSRDGYQHKTSKLGKDRVIYLTPEVAEIVERNIATEQNYLFPSDKGKNYAGHRGRNQLYRMIKSRPEIIRYCQHINFNWKRIILYGFRHSYATRALTSGVLVTDLATLMGTSVVMITRCYGHLCNQKDHLRSVANKIAQR